MRCKTQMKEKNSDAPSLMSSPRARRSLSRTHTVSLSPSNAQTCFCSLFSSQAPLVLHRCCNLVRPLIPPLSHFPKRQASLVFSSFGGHLQKKRQGFEVPALLKWCLTSEWSETPAVRSLRGANLTPHNSTLSLSAAAAAARGGGGEGGESRGSWTVIIIWP